MCYRYSEKSSAEDHLGHAHDILPQKPKIICIFGKGSPYSILKYPNTEYMIKIDEVLEKQHKEIDEYLKSEERESNDEEAQREGRGSIYGYQAEDFEYARLRRRGESGANVELLLVCIGYNLRRYHDRKRAKKVKSFSQWGKGGY